MTKTNHTPDGERPTPPATARPKYRRALKVSAFFVAAHLVGFATSLHALMDTRTAPGSVAWIVSLNTFPYLAVPAYWVFGRSEFQDYVRLRSERTSAPDESLAERSASLERFRASWPEVGQRGLRAVERVAQLPFLGGNQVELLVDGVRGFESMFEGIAAAEEYLLVQFYIVRDDALGMEFQRRLIERAQGGVRVYLLLDEVGSIQLPRSYTDALVAAGVQVRAFHSTRGWTNKFQLNLRNHRKLVIADGRRGWVGGLNVGDEYLEQGWRDTHLRIEGPAVLHLQLAFLEDWRWATDDVPEVSWSPHTLAAEGVPVLILPTGPADRFETTSLMVQQFAHLAEERLWISSPYFVPDEGVVASLKLAALAGLDVRLLIPERGDNLLASLAAYTFLDGLIAAGVKIFHYEAGMLHGKVFLIDRSGAAVSSVNLDNRSLRLNFELTALVADSTFARDVEVMFERDFANAREVTAEVFADKGLWFRVAARAAYLFAPVL